METVNLADVRVSTEALETVPFELANHKVIPLEVDDSEAELAIFDPLDMHALDSISHVIKRSITQAGSRRSKRSIRLSINTTKVLKRVRWTTSFLGWKTRRCSYSIDLPPAKMPAKKKRLYWRCPHGDFRSAKRRHRIFIWNL